MKRAAYALAISVAIAVLAFDPAALASTPKRALLWIVALACAAVSIAMRVRPLLSRAALAYGGLVVWSTLSLTWGNRTGALDAALWLAGVPIVLALRAFPVAIARHAAQRVATAIVVSVALLAIGWRTHAGQGNADWAGLALAIALPLVADVLFADESSRAQRIVHLAVLLVGIAGLIVCRSRTAWVAVISAAWIVLARSGRMPRVLVGSAAAIVFVAAHADRSTRDAFGGRLWIWSRTLDAIRETTPVGIGLGDFASVFLRTQADVLAKTHSLHDFVAATTAHNEWLQLTLEGGVPAIVLFALLVLFAVRACWRMRWAGGLGAVVAFAIAACADAPLRQPTTLVVLWFVMGALPADATAMRASRVIPFLLLVVGALASSLSLGTWLGERLTARARNELVADRIATLGIAARLAPCSFDIAFERGLAAHEARALEPPALTLLRTAHAMQLTVGGEVAIGNTYFVAEQYSEAARHFQNALALDPGSLRAAINLGHTELRQHHLREARAALAHAQRIYRYHPAVDALRAAIDEHP